MHGTAAIFFSLVSLLIGLVAGMVMHRSDYCVASMFRDALLFGDTFLLRALCLQVVCTMLLFELLRRCGLLPLYPFPMLAAPSLANLIGGALFGFGMVLAGGCVVGTLYKMGAGSIPSCAAFIGLIVGSGFYAEIHPQWLTFSRATALGSAITLPRLLHLDPTMAIAAVAVPASFLLWRWHRHHDWERPTEVRGYLQPWRTAMVLAFLGALSYLLLGIPMGISTTYAKLAARLETLLVPAHAAHLAYFRTEAIHVFFPPAGVLLRGGAGPAFDAVWFIQAPLVAGIVVGSALSAVRLGEFAPRFGVPTRQLLTALVGGIVMGLAARMVPGCNIWHLMGGLPVLALSSLLFVVGLLPGTWLGGRLLIRILQGKHPPLACKRLS